MKLKLTKLLKDSFQKREERHNGKKCADYFFETLSFSPFIPVRNKHYLIVPDIGVNDDYPHLFIKCSSYMRRVSLLGFSISCTAKGK